MEFLHTLAGTDAGAAAIARATVVALEGDLVVVEPERGAGEFVRCLLLQSSEAPPPRLSPGDVVLVWWQPAALGHGVVLGRLVAATAAAPTITLPAPAPAAPAPAAPAEGAAGAPAVPDELVIEARQGLTIRCGDGAITLRADGRVLIKGRDLVSHAQRTNRIRGGSVAIN